MGSSQINTPNNKKTNNIKMVYEEDNEKLVRSADFDGPTKDRRCTDVLCIGLIFAMWGVMTGIGIYAMQEGDYRLVLYPMDYDGNVCGTDYGSIDMTEYPNLYYVNSFTGGVCVKDCPSVKLQDDENATETTDSTSNATTTTADDSNSTTIDEETSRIDIRTFITYGGVWQADGAWLDPNFLETANYTGSEDALFCDEESCFPDSDDPSASWSSRGVRRGFGYAYYAGDTYELLWRCYYTTTAERQIEQALGGASDSGIGNLEIVNDATAVWNRLFADLYAARKYVLGFGFGVSLAVSFTYIFLMRLPILLDFMIWVSILMTIAMFGLGGYFSWQYADTWTNEDPQTVDDKTINVSLFCVA